MQFEKRSECVCVRLRVFVSVSLWVVCSCCVAQCVFIRVSPGFLCQFVRLRELGACACVSVFACVCMCACVVVLVDGCLVCASVWCGRTYHLNTNNDNKQGHT